jgi:YcxB-like protein
MEHASVTIQLAIEDVVAFSGFVARSSARMRRGLLLWVIAIVLFAAEYLLSAGHKPGAGSFHLNFLPIVIAVAVFFLLVKFLLRRRLRSEALWKENNPSLFLPNLCQVLDEGLYVENDRMQLLTRWTALVRVGESAKHFFVMETRIRGYIFPKRCFAAPEAAANFADQVRLQIEKHAAAPSVTA